MWLSWFKAVNSSPRSVTCVGGLIDAICPVHKARDSNVPRGPVHGHYAKVLTQLREYEWPKTGAIRGAAAERQPIVRAAILP